MISITKLTVPAYLHNSGFYQLLATDECEPFDVPNNAFKADLVLSGEQDVENLLFTLRFWMADDIPLELIEYSVCASSTELFKTFAPFCRELAYLPHLTAFSKTSEDSQRLEIATRSGFTQLVRYALDHAEDPTDVTLTKWHCRLALKVGNAECLAFLHARGCPWYEGDNCTDNEACLLLALQHSPYYMVDLDECVRDERIAVLDVLIDKGQRWTKDAARSTAARGQLSMLRYLHQRGCTEWTGVTAAAAKAGHLEILQFAYEHGLPWDADTTSSAAVSNEVECLTYAHEHGALWCDKTTMHAARGASLQCMIYAHEHGCPWTTPTDHFCTLRAAADCRHWRCFQYALEHGCPYTVDVAATVAGRSLRMLKYLKEERGCEWDLQACMKQAAAYGSTPCLLYLLSQDNSLPANESVICSVAVSGDLATLKLVCKADVKPTRKVCAAAASGSVECLEYVHSLGGTLTYSVLCTAAGWGRLDCLKYLVHHGCPLISSTLAPSTTLHHHHQVRSNTAVIAAADCGYLDCIMYLHEVGCPITMSREDIDDMDSDTDCKAFLLSLLPAEDAV